MAEFIVEVARYFLDFLETDFKRQNYPKRQCGNLSAANLMLGVDLDGYDKLRKKIYSATHGSTFGKFVINKGEFLKSLQKTNSAYIQNKIEKIDEKTLLKVREDLPIILNVTKESYKLEFEKYFDSVMEQSKEMFLEHFIDPFFSDLDFLKRFDVRQMKDDLADVLISNIESSIADIINRKMISEEEIDFDQELDGLITVEQIQSVLRYYFDNFYSADLFDSVSELIHNKAILDKYEFYLYFYDISINLRNSGKRLKFPLFYLPINVIQGKDSIEFVFDNRLFLNNKAINYILQEVMELHGTKYSLKSEFSRINYVENNINDFVEPVVRKIAQTVGIRIDENIFSNAETKISISDVSISNKYYAFIFDKSDEALLNDYEAILENPLLLNEYDKLLNSFIMGNPISIRQQIESDWEQLPISKKLVFESPVPLNAEQKQILLALRDDQSKYYIIEGPPGTGKSHTITAVICEAILSNKSVLVLSDKNEALDVVQAKITNTLNKVRSGDEFQNPVLRLGKFQNTLNRIVQQQSIKNIRNHLNAYNSEKDSVLKEKTQLQNSIQKEINTEKSTLTNIRMEDVIYYFQNEDEFKDYPAILKINENSENDLYRVHDIIHKLRKSKIQFSRDTIINANIDTLRNIFRIGNNILNIKESIDVFDISVFIKIVDLSPSSRVLLDSRLTNLTKVMERIEHLKNNYPVKWVEKYSDQKNISEIVDLFKNIKILRRNISSIERSFFIDRLPPGFLANFQFSDEIGFDESVAHLGEFFALLQKYNLPIFGILFSRKKVQEINDRLKTYFLAYQISNPEKHIDNFTMLLQILDKLRLKIPDDEPLIKEAYTYIENDSFQAGAWEKPLDEFISLDNEIRNLVNTNFKLSDVDTLRFYILIANLFDDISKEREGLNSFENQICTGLKYSNLDDLSGVITRVKTFTDELVASLHYKADIMLLESFELKYPDISRQINLVISKNKNISEFDWIFESFDIDELHKFLRFSKIEAQLTQIFSGEQTNTYQPKSRKLEEHFTLDMASIMDQSIIDYYDNFANDLGILKTHLRKKAQFPIALFGNMKKAFPCILAGIRDYAEYIPLEKDLFDLIIIDEASQVNIAQTLPALIRGKKILVLGDDKQFSNVKSHNAKNETNNQYKGRIVTEFKSKLEKTRKNYQDEGLLVNVKENIDVKVSILKFIKFIRNYDIMLTQHFRCFPEIISYSDKYFYNNNLESVRLRAHDIKEVIKFTVLDTDSKIELFQNTNQLEIDFIINTLRDFKIHNFTRSIGIITPFREQLKLLYEKIKATDIYDWLITDCHLKIMTFDTCQGEERDYIFYSMVAIKERDRLNFIFPVDFANVNLEEDGSLKAQRLNVGFSRARDTIHFVLSKNPEEFTGEIGQALRHYQNILINKNPVKGKTDPNSPAEPIILRHIMNTQFFKTNQEKIEIFPQFQLGKHIKQTVNNANLRDYVVDFLILMSDEKIVVEYDGFKEHFIQNGENVDFSNYEYYMKEKDLYRQKVLENFGYKFIRLNKFNLGSDPVSYIDGQLNQIVKKNDKSNEQNSKVVQAVNDLSNGKKRHCRICNTSYPPEYIPYIHQDICLDCYEFVKIRKLKTKRSELSRKTLADVQSIDNGKKDLTVYDLNNAIKNSEKLLISGSGYRYWVEPSRIVNSTTFIAQVCSEKISYRLTGNWKLIAKKSKL